MTDCDETCEGLRAAADTALRRRPRPEAPSAYGAGRAGQGIARMLAATPVDETLRRKQITY